MWRGEAWSGRDGCSVAHFAFGSFDVKPAGDTFLDVSVLARARFDQRACVGQILERGAAEDALCSGAVAACR